MVRKEYFLRIYGTYKSENGCTDSQGALAKAIREELGRQYAEGSIDSPKVEIVEEPNGN